MAGIRQYLTWEVADNVVDQWNSREIDYTYRADREARKDGESEYILDTKRMSRDTSYYCNRVAGRRYEDVIRYSL